MKKISSIKRMALTLLACMTLATTAMAEVTDMNVGYCAGEQSTDGKYNVADANVYVSAAIYIPAGTLNTYAGNDLVGVRAALASKLGIDELKVWVRKDLKGENLAESANITTDSTPKILKGWNTLDFTAPYKIEAGNTEGIYIGYTFHQKSSAFGISYLKESMKNGYFMQVGTGEWEDHSADGTLSIEGVVRGENLPKINAQFANATMPRVLVIERGEARVMGTVKNIASKNITGFDVQAILNGTEAGRVHVDCDIAFNKTAPFDITIQHGLTEMKDGTFALKIVNVNGQGDDEDMSDNLIESPYTAVQRDFTKKIFVEEFTTEACVNCPRVAGFLHELLAEDKYKENVVTVCHHAGYYTDWLTIPSDTEYLWLFNQGGSTYAPAVMTDRAIYKDKTPVYCPSQASEISTEWNKHLLKSAYVSLNITAEQNAEVKNKVTVKVTGARAFADFCEKPYITVYLVENDIKARSQAGASGEYFQQHVTRAVNSTWGSPLTFENDEYTYSCEFAISQTWKPENMEIVAMVYNYNSKDAADCEVQNANTVALSKYYTPSTNAVESVEMAQEAAEYYTFDGVKVIGDPAPGIYLKKVGNEASKVVVN